MMMILLLSSIPIVIHSFFTTGKVMMKTLASVSMIALIGISLTLIIVLTAELAILI